MKCSKCEIDYPEPSIRFFYRVKSSSNKRGFGSQCRQCHLTYANYKGKKPTGWDRFSIRQRLHYYTQVNVETKCFNWTGTLNHNGYGILGFWRRNYLAHRLAWEIAHDPILDPKLCVLHKCDNRKCINPEHLFLGTRQDNTLDMVAKGRQKNGPNAKPFRTAETKNAH